MILFKILFKFLYLKTPRSTINKKGPYKKEKLHKDRVDRLETGCFCVCTIVVFASYYIACSVPPLSFVVTVSTWEGARNQYCGTQLISILLCFSLFRLFHHINTKDRQGEDQGVCFGGNHLARGAHCTGSRYPH